MPSVKKLLIIFIPAIIIALVTLSIRVLQYIPTETKAVEQTDSVYQSLIPIFENDPILGSKKAGHTVIIFADFACEACAAQDKILEDLMKKHRGQIKVIWKGLPVARFPFNSLEAHRYAYCANEQNKFEQFAKLTYTNSDNLSSAAIGRIVNEIGLDQEKMKRCLESNRPDEHIELNKQLASSLNIQAVPAIFYNNKQHKSPRIIEQWEALLNL